MDLLHPVIVVRQQELDNHVLLLSVVMMIVPKRRVEYWIADLQWLEHALVVQLIRLK